MKWNNRLRYLLLFFNCIILCPAAGLLAQQRFAAVHLHLLNTAGGTVIAPGDSCTNQYGETFTVRNFRYYLSHIQLADSTGQFYEAADEAGGTFLVDFADSSSQHIVLKKHGKARFIRFLIGVDSSKNVSGVLTGVLDPARGMYWTWNSGYVMAKLEGRSDKSTAPGRNFTYHVGGYKATQQTVRWVTLPLPLTTSKHITLTADILQWFGGKDAISIATHPVCHEPGPLAVRIADNYAHMFTVWEPVETRP